MLQMSQNKKELMDAVYAALDFMESQLKKQKYLGGSNLTIADVQVFNEVFESHHFLQFDLAKYSSVKAWFDTVGEEETVKDLCEQFKGRLA